MAEREAGYYWVREKATGYAPLEDAPEPWGIAQWFPADERRRGWKYAHWMFPGSEMPSAEDGLEIGERIPDHV